MGLQFSSLLNSFDKLDTTSISMKCYLCLVSALFPLSLPICAYSSGSRGSSMEKLILGWFPLMNILYVSNGIATFYDKGITLFKYWNKGLIGIASLAGLGCLFYIGNEIVTNRRYNTLTRDDYTKAGIQLAFLSGAMGVFLISQKIIFNFLDMKTKSLL